MARFGERRILCFLMLDYTLRGDMKPLRQAKDRVESGLAKVFATPFAGFLCYSPNLTLKNWVGGLPGGVTSMVAFTALFFSFTSTPLVIGEAESSPATVSAR